MSFCFLVLVWCCCGARCYHAHSQPGMGPYSNFQEVLPLAKSCLTLKLRSTIHRVGISSFALQVFGCGQVWFAPLCQADGWHKLWASGKAISWCGLFTICLTSGVCGLGGLVFISVCRDTNHPQEFWSFVMDLKWWPPPPLGSSSSHGGPWSHWGSLGPYLGASFSQHLIWTLIVSPQGWSVSLLMLPLGKFFFLNTSLAGSAGSSGRGELGCHQPKYSLDVKPSCESWSLQGTQWYPCPALDTSLGFSVSLLQNGK